MKDGSALECQATFWLTFILLVAFGLIPVAPTPWYVVMIVTAVVWVVSANRFCGVMIYGIIARLLGKPTTLGSETLGGCCIRDVDGSTHADSAPRTDSKQRKR